MSRRRTLCRSFSAALLLGLFFAASGALAQGRRLPPPGAYDEMASTPPEERESTLLPKGSLRGSFGLPVAMRLLESASAEDRLRGIKRLAAIGTPEAMDALVGTIEQSSVVTRDGRARLVAMRFFAMHADKENVRPLLLREIADAGPEGRGASAVLGTETRAAAALGLARSGDKKALVALVTAVLQGGPAAESAQMALVEYPPSTLAPFFEGKRRIEPVFATLLADLGDVRAIEKLRGALEDADVGHRAAAALALARLGDGGATNLAKTWVRSQDTRLQRVGAEVLLRLGQSGASDAVAALLKAPSTRIDGVRLAALAPSPTLVKPLVEALESLPESEQQKAIAIVGRCGGAEATSALLAELAKPTRATAAAFALARVVGKEGRAALERALGSTSAKQGAPRRLIVRAALLRTLVQDDEPSGLGAALSALANEKDESDRALSLFGRVATRRTKLKNAIEEACGPEGKACRTELVASLARAALALGEDALLELAPLLGRQSAEREPSALTVALGVAMLADPEARAVSTSTLLAWAEGGGPLAPLAARALPSRDDEALRGRLKRLFAGTDPVIRAHLALGLARDREPDAVSLLADAYMFEDDASVRRAIVRALSARSEPQRKATLAIARDLDADSEVRSLAKAALLGRSLLPSLASPSPEAIWVSLVASAPSALSSVKSRSARLVRPDGLALPIVTDPDGVVLVPSLPAGRSFLTLAPE